MYIKYDHNDNSHRKEKLPKIIRITYMECIIHYNTSKSWWILCTSEKWLKYCRHGVNPYTNQSDLQAWHVASFLT